MKTLLILLLTLTLNLYGSNHEDELRFQSTGINKISNTYFMTLTSKTGDYEIWICCNHSMGDVYSANGIIVKKDQMSTFIQRLTLARNKYIEWVNVASKGDAKDYYLKLNNTSSNYKLDMHLNAAFDCFYGSSTQSQTKIKKEQIIKYNFLIFDNCYFLLLESDNLIGMDYINLYFNSVEEIDGFIKVISNIK